MIYRVVLSLLILAAVAAGVLFHDSKETVQSPAQASQPTPAPAQPGDDGLKGFKIP